MIILRFVKCPARLQTLCVFQKAESSRELVIQKSKPSEFKRTHHSLPKSHASEADIKKFYKVGTHNVQ